MKTMVHMMCAALLLAGCSQREPESIRITFAGPDRLVTGGKVHTRRELQTALRGRVQKYGMANTVILQAPGETVYSNLVSALDVAASSGFWRYRLALSDGDLGQEFFRYPGDGPPNVDVDIDLVTMSTLVDGVSSSRDLADILATDTNTFYRVWVLPADTTTVSQLIVTLEVCGRHQRTLPLIVPREDRIANQASQATSLRAEPER